LINGSGLGLTGGMLDAGCLADAFEGLLKENQPDSILTKYADIRREIFKKYTDPWSQENVKRLYSLDPETAINDPFLQAVRNASETEESREAFVRRPEVLRVDIRKFFV
jgi:2-polyprenyl-6-methoxyphenol hydroxylase-like FAD-dependent oxidoreductase